MGKRPLYDAGVIMVPIIRLSFIITCVIFKELKEPKRDRKKTKNIKHSGSFCRNTLQIQKSNAGVHDIHTQRYLTWTRESHILVFRPKKTSTKYGNLCKLVSLHDYFWECQESHYLFKAHLPVCMLFLGVRIVKRCSYRGRVTNFPYVKATLPKQIQDTAGRVGGYWYPPPLPLSSLDHLIFPVYPCTSPTTAHWWTPPSSPFFHDLKEGIKKHPLKDMYGSQ